MWRRIFATGLVAGAVCGGAVCIVQHFTTTPLLLRAEQFEHAAAGTAAETVTAAGALSAAALRRTMSTAVTTVLLAMGFALILSGVFALHPKLPAVDAAAGVLWGAAGFTVFMLAPALGMPPAVPGAAVAELGARQWWWLATVAATAAGLWLLVFGGLKTVRVAAVALLALPHVAGAPAPAVVAPSEPPAQLAAQFAAATLAVGALFWALLGAVTAALYRRWVVAR